MKDQGKISELNPDTASRCVSSHCYQTSSSVGQMAETYTPQGFLGFHIKSGPSPKERASEKTLNESSKGLQRTHSRKARRQRSRARAIEQLLSSLPPDASYQERLRVIYPNQARQSEAAAFNRTARIQKHDVYGEFVRQFNQKHNLDGYDSLKMSKYLYSDVFSPDYDSQLPEPYSASPQAMNLALAHLESRSTINRSRFSNAKPSLLPPRPTTIGQDLCPPQLGMPDYGPQSGLVPAIYRTGAATSKTNQANYTPQAGKVPVDISTLSLRLLDSERFVTFPDNIQEGLHLLYHLCSFRNYFHTGLAIVLFYVLLRVVIDICLTIRFVVGCLLGLFIPRPSFNSAYPPQRARSFYVPQSGEAETLELAPESSDFQGVKPDASAVAEPTAPVPLATNKDHSSCLASSSTSSSLPASGHLVNASVGFALGLRSPAKPSSAPRQTPAPQQARLTRSLGFGC